MKKAIISWRKIFLFAAVAVLATSKLNAATVVFNDGRVNGALASGPDWVNGSKMFQYIVLNFAGADGITGGSGSSQHGFNVFSPSGGGLDVTLLT